MNIHSTEDAPPSPTHALPQEVSDASPTINAPLPTMDLASLQETTTPKEVVPAPENDTHEETIDNLLLVMSISVGDGKSYNLPVNENDDPYELARKFCKQHNLEDNVIEPLAQNIYSNMEKVLEASVNNPITHRDASQSMRERSPFPRQSGDFLEPEHKEERFKRGVDSEEEEMLEQMEKPCSGEMEDSSKKIAQKALNNLLQQAKPNTKAQKYDETSLVAKSGAVLESIYMDMSGCSTIRLGELVDDNKLIENIRKMEQQNSVKNQESSAKEERLSTNSKLRTEVINLITEEEPHERSQTDRHGMLKSSSEAKLGSTKYRAVSPIKSYNELDKYTPKKSPNTDRTYRQIFQQKEAQKPRQRSSELTMKKRSTLESTRAANMSMTNLGSTATAQNRTSNSKERTAREDDGAKKDTMTRTKSASRLRSTDELSFRPKINKQSEKIVIEKQKQRQSLGATPHQRLFNQHKSREATLEQKSQIMSEECTFKPAINNYSGTGTPIGRMSFQERNKHYQTKAREQRELMHRKELLDTSTGKPLFRPATGRPPSTSRNREKLPIGDYLYKQRPYGGESVLNTSSTRDPNSSFVHQAPVEKAQTVFEKRFMKKLVDLFQNLDSDKDGVISAENVDINPIETFDLQVIAPILCAMEEQCQTLNLESFIEETIRAIKNLPIPERDQFLFGEKRQEVPKDNEKYAFRPQINKRSAEMAKNKRPSGDFNALYEKLMKDKKEKEEKIRREQEKKRDSELQYCSFQPQVNRKSYRPAKRDNEDDY